MSLLHALFSFLSKLMAQRPIFINVFYEKFLLSSNRMDLKKASRQTSRCQMAFHFVYKRDVISSRKSTRDYVKIYFISPMAGSNFQSRKLYFIFK